MASCQRVSKLLKAIGRLTELSGGPDFASDFFGRMLRAGHGAKYQEIMAELAEMSSDSLRGFISVVDLIRAQNGDNVASNIVDVFNRIPDRADLSRFLDLWRQARGTGNVPRGLDVLANSLLGRNNIRGVWYQLDFSRTSGFQNVRGYEISFSDDQIRGIDTVLKSPFDGTFFECKCSNNFKIDQAKRQLRELAAAQGAPSWMEYRIVMNVQEGDLHLQAAKFLDDFAGTASATENPFAGIIATLRNQNNGFDIAGFLQNNSFANNLTSNPHRAMIEQVRAWFFRSHIFDPPVAVGR